MKMKSLRKLLEKESQKLPYWWDEDLERDGISSSEWGFSQGYYIESEAY